VIICNKASFSIKKVQMAKDYLPRVIDPVIKSYIKTFEAVLIEGPKWCGKTTSAMKVTKTHIKLQDPRRSRDFLKIAETEPINLLEGPTPLLLDEWQMAPILWDTVRAEVDERGKTGQFVLTGSSVPPSTDQMHTGTGRIARLMMRPMSLLESNESTGQVSLKNLFDSKKIPNSPESKLSIKDLGFAICRGGWPSALKVDRDHSHLIARDYLNSVCEADISRMDGVEKKPSRVKAVLRSYARNISTLATNKTILDDVRANDVGIAESTLYSYLNALSRLFIIDDVKAWSPAIRSKSVIRASNKKSLVDPSLAAAALGITYQNMFDDMQTFGLMFESLCMRDLRVYAQALGGQVFYYHDRYGLECDAVICLDDGRYGLVEIKLGEKEVDLAAEHLLKIRQLTLEAGMNPPKILMILTGGKRCYHRKDGIIVVPIGCLGD
jgi:predicted AAA+ superfamily ATPase